MKVSPFQDFWDGHRSLLKEPHSFVWMIWKACSMFDVHMNIRWCGIKYCSHGLFTMFSFNLTAQMLKFFKLLFIINRLSYWIKVTSLLKWCWRQRCKNVLYISRLAVSLQFNQFQNQFGGL
jgi:hypothetical protein